MPKIVQTTAILMLSFCCAAAMAQQDSASCQKEVKDYVNALRFVKQTSGSGIGGRVEQVFVNESDLAQIVQLRGNCAAVQVLRQKGVAR